MGWTSLVYHDLKVDHIAGVDVFLFYHGARKEKLYRVSYYGTVCDDSKKYKIYIVG
jgi:hypothetical protein